MSNSLPSIFDDCSDAQIDEALKYFQGMEVDFGVELIREGEEDTTLVCVLKGELEIKTGGVVLGRARSGDLVGEMALFGHGVRTASVETNTQCELLLLDRIGYEALRYLGNPAGVAIEERALDLLTERLRSIGDKIAELAEGTPVEHKVPSKGFFASVASIFGSGGGRVRPRRIDPVEALRNSPLFDGIPEEALSGLSELFVLNGYSVGTFLCTEGEPGMEMYVLADGLVDVLIDTHETKVEPLAVLEPGEAFGMGSLVHPTQPRMASCVVKQKATVLELDKITWAETIHNYDLVGSALRTAMIRALIDQLAYANGQLALLEQATESGQMKGLLKASAGMEAHGAYLEE